MNYFEENKEFQNTLNTFEVNLKDVYNLIQALKNKLQELLIK
jgi:hypothetical protein